MVGDNGLRIGVQKMRQIVNRARVIEVERGDARRDGNNAILRRKESENQRDLTGICMIMSGLA
jgi:hypothetical protein